MRAQGSADDARPGKNVAMKIVGDNDEAGKVTLRVAEIGGS
jgi:hypothetical protein